VQIKSLSLVSKEPVKPHIQLQLKHWVDLISRDIITSHVCLILYELQKSVKTQAA